MDYPKILVDLKIVLQFELVGEYFGKMNYRFVEVQIGELCIGLKYICICVCFNWGHPDKIKQGSYLHSKIAIFCQFQI